MHKIPATIIFLCVFISGLHAQDRRYEYTDTSLLNETRSIEIPSGDAYQQPIDEEKDILSDTLLYITDIKISPDTIKAWKNDRRFAYIKNMDSLLEIKQRQDIEALRENGNSKNVSFLQRLLSSNIIQGFFWMVAVLFVLFILYKLFLSEGMFKRNSTASAVKVLPEEEKLVTVSDYDKLLHQSIKLGDYRMAVRWLFLKTLAMLIDKEYVQQSTDKTNFQYVQEITADKRNEFASLVLTYEYSWYGNFPLTQDLFTGIEKKFSLFWNKI